MKNIQSKLTLQIYRKFLQSINEFKIQSKTANDNNQNHSKLLSSISTQQKPTNNMQKM